MKNLSTKEVFSMFAEHAIDGVSGFYIFPSPRFSNGFGGMPKARKGDAIPAHDYRVTLHNSRPGRCIKAVREAIVGDTTFFFIIYTDTDKNRRNISGMTIASILNKKLQYIPNAIHKHMDPTKKMQLLDNNGNFCNHGVFREYMRRHGAIKDVPQRGAIFLQKFLNIKWVKIWVLVAFLGGNPKQMSTKRKNNKGKVGV